MKTASAKIVCILLLASLVSCGGGSRAEKGGAAPPVRADVPVDKPWKLVATQGAAQFVYVQPEKAHDAALMAQILQVLVGQKSKITKPVWVMFFDSESETPRAFPMSDSQMLHQTAQYNYNPNNGFEEFLWFTVADAKASPPDLTSRKDSISPGMAP